MDTEQLKQILQDQRTRRMAMKSPTQQHGNGMSWKTFFTLLSVVLFSFGVLVGMIYLSKSGISPAVTSVLTQTAIPPSASPSVTIPANGSASAKVCTDIPDGRLHVRFTPGDGSEVRGYLAEGESVQIVLSNSQLESQTVKGETWLKLLSPIEGWTNAVYICDMQK